MSTGLSAKIRAATERASLRPLTDLEAEQLEAYISLLVRWNTRVNLTAIRNEDAIIDRHIIESIFVGERLPGSVQTLMDFGSGAGLPGIPIAIRRPGIQVTLVESQNKKAAFLREAVRVLKLSSKVYTGRAEDLTVKFDCVTMRAVERMAAAIVTAARLVATGGSLALLTTESDLNNLRELAGSEFEWLEPAKLPGSETRVLAFGKRAA